MEQFRAKAPAGALIGNHESLLAHGLTEMRALALRVAEAGMAACDPALAVENLVQLKGDELLVDGRPHPLHPGGRVVILGAGKASLKIALALETILGDRLDGGEIAVRLGSAFASPKRLGLIEASHPIPDERSAAAAAKMLDCATGLCREDLLIACFTGGSSALASLPPAGVSVAEKRDLHRRLLGSGMPISEVNAVRKQVSAFKGGRLAAAAAPARVINLSVSDVAGDRLDVLTDPTVQDRSTAAEARAILTDRGLWNQVAPSIREVLADPEAGSPDLCGVDIHTTLLATGETACAAMAADARAAHAEPFVLSTSLEEEAVAVGRILGQLAAESARLGRPFPGPAVLIGCGGEGTVGLGPDDEFGSGGPNQEAALAAAEPLGGAEAAAVFIDTDGSDGGTDLAGAISDGATLARAAEAGIDLHAALRSHRSGAAVKALGDGIETGPTHTNVNDLFAIAIGAASPEG